MMCDKESTCLNKDKCCYKCFNYAFYKPEQKQVKQRKSFDKHAKDSWKGLESDVAHDLSNIEKGYEARRQIASGALWFAPGDVDDPIAFLECKERKPTEANGTKSFTISKDWIDKAMLEAKETDKPMFLPFRFKGDDEILVVTNWKNIAELITTVKSLMIELEQDKYNKEKGV